MANMLKRHLSDGEDDAIGLKKIDRTFSLLLKLFVGLGCVLIVALTVYQVWSHWPF